MDRSRSAEESGEGDPRLPEHHVQSRRGGKHTGVLNAEGPTELGFTRAERTAVQKHLPLVIRGQELSRG